MRKFILSLFVVLPIISFSQERATISRLQQDKEICKAFAEKSIQEISDGVLLVRLNFRQKQVDYLNARDTAAANSLVSRTLKSNQKITQAFSDNFDFCTVYFFKMSDSKHVRNQQFDSVTFYDHNFNEIDSSKLATENYLIGEFSTIKQDTSYYYDESRFDTSKEKSKSKVYYGGSKNGREAFIIMDRKFQQIQKPFPYFAAMQILAPGLTRFKKAIGTINIKLHSYSSQVGKKEEPTETSN